MPPTDSPAPSPTSPRLAHIAYQWPRGAGLPAQSTFPPHKNPSVSTTIASFSNTRAQSWLSKRDREAFLTSGAPDPLHGLLPCTPISSSVSLALSMPAVSPYLSQGLSLSLLQADCLQRRLHKSRGADREGVWGGHSVSFLGPYWEKRSCCSGRRLEFRPG